jgi:HD-like signal output (HDOD) protein
LFRTIGYLVARTWKLPAYLCEAINEHHYCEERFSSDKHKAPQKNNLLAVLKLAEHLCGEHRVIGMCEVDNEFERIREGLLGYMGLTQIDIENLKDDLVEHGICI